MELNFKSKLSAFCCLIEWTIIQCYDVFPAYAVYSSRQWSAEGDSVSLHWLAWSWSASKWSHSHQFHQESSDESPLQWQSASAGPLQCWSRKDGSFHCARQHATENAGGAESEHLWILQAAQSSASADGPDSGTLEAWHIIIKVACILYYMHALTKMLFW